MARSGGLEVTARRAALLGVWVARANSCMLVLSLEFKPTGLFPARAEQLKAHGNVSILFPAQCFDFEKSRSGRWIMTNHLAGAPPAKLSWG